MVNQSAKMLFLTPELPYPLFSGGKIKSYKLFRFLNDKYDLTFASILKGDDAAFIDDFVAVSSIDKPIMKTVNRKRTIKNLLISYLKRIPLNIYRTESKEFKKAVACVINGFDLVFVDHYEMFQYIPKNYKGHVILHEHNAYHLMWKRYAQDRSQPFAKRLISYIEYRRVKKMELRCCEAANIVFASPNDIDTLVSLGIKKDKFHYTYHLGDDSQLSLPSLQFENTNKSLLYIGSLNWEANIDGLLWFINGVWPVIKSYHPSLSFTIIGKDPDTRLSQVCKQFDDIHLEGFIRDIEPYCLSHRVFVAPLRFGAGMKVKVLNAMCRGMPTVTTRIGCEGMDVVDNKHLCIADSVEKMVIDIDRLLKDPTHWNVLENESRKLVSDRYTWQALFHDMGNVIDRQFENIT